MTMEIIPLNLLHLEDITMILTQTIMIIPGVLVEEMVMSIHQENQRQANKLNLEYDRLQQQDEQSDKRLDIAERKLEK